MFEDGVAGVGAGGNLFDQLCNSLDDTPWVGVKGFPSRRGPGLGCFQPHSTPWSSSRVRASYRDPELRGPPVGSEGPFGPQDTGGPPGSLPTSSVVQGQENTT